MAPELPREQILERLRTSNPRCPPRAGPSGATRWPACSSTRCAAFRASAGARCSRGYAGPPGAERCPGRIREPGARGAASRDTAARARARRAAAEGRGASTRGGRGCPPEEEVQRLRQAGTGAAAAGGGTGAFHDALRRVAEAGPRTSTSCPSRRTIAELSGHVRAVLVRGRSRDHERHDVPRPRRESRPRAERTSIRACAGSSAGASRGPSRTPTTPEGSAAAAREHLRLVGILGDALVRIVRSGSQKILGEMDPESAIQRHSRAVLGPDYSAAFRAVQEGHRKVSGYLDAELWEIYYQPAFKIELGKHIEP